MPVAGAAHELGQLRELGAVDPAAAAMGAGDGWDGAGPGLHPGHRRDRSWVAEMALVSAAPGAAAGLSAHAQALWLAAVRYRRRADALAGADAGAVRP